LGEWNVKCVNANGNVIEKIDIVIKK
jgi:hypothetical protein